MTALPRCVRRARARNAVRSPIIGPPNRATEVAAALNFPKGVRSAHRDHQGPMIKGPAMSDKSPRQTMTKKSGKSLKEKRAAKQAKTAARASSTESLLHDKKR